MSLPVWTVSCFQALYILPGPSSCVYSVLGPSSREDFLDTPTWNTGEGHKFRPTENFTQFVEDRGWPILSPLLVGQKLHASAPRGVIGNPGGQAEIAEALQ